MTPHSLRSSLGLAFSVLLLAACSSVGKPKATLVLVNGNFFTVDSLNPHASALAIRGDRILYVGDDAGATALADRQTRIIDLKGAFVMPGFIEGHGHFSSLGRSRQNLDLGKSNNWDEIVAMVAEKARQTPAGHWIEGRGWHQEKWSARPVPSFNGYPYHDALSAVSAGHPVVLVHASGHSLFANAKAMELAGVGLETPDPAGGRIVRDASGRLTGVFEENAMDLITAPYTAWKNQRSEDQKRADFEKSVEMAGQECLGKGITSFTDAGSDFWEIGQYRRLAEAGQLPLRLWVMIAQPAPADYPKLADYPQIGLGNDFLTVRAVKVYLDGALGSYGAWLLEPYADKPGFYGQNTAPIDTLRAIARLCRQHRLQCCVHAIGDRGNREVLNVFEESLSGAPEDQRWRIEHAQHIDPQDMPRFRQLGVIASMQAIHCTSDAPFVVKRLGEDRARTGAYAWRSLLDEGAWLANGTDTPVEDCDPLACLYASVTRRRVDSGLEFFPEQKMTREEALYSYTLWNARAAFEEKDKGSLEPGKLADIVVLSKDLLRCPEEEILQARVLQTIVGGQIKFSR